MQEYKKYAHDLVDWMFDYLQQVENFSVKPNVEPNQVLQQLDKQAPLKGENFKRIFSDFKKIILPNLTHWQHPNFYAYFPANNSQPSILAEMLIATLGLQCMNWQTSPAATELEECVMNWLRNLLGLPNNFHGVIQDGASVATLCAILTAREKFSDFQINQQGYDRNQYKFTCYCSNQAHASVIKAIRISGLGEQNLRLINTYQDQSLDVKMLEKQIKLDITAGLQPLCVIGVIGTTSTCAIDDIAAIGKLCKKHNIWLHVDAAYLGVCLMLPEYAWMREGLNYIDSLVFNPQKWMLTNLYCTAYFIRDKNALIKTLGILPEYLKTFESDEVNDYRNWGITLGRQFRALKLWFVLRAYGVEGIQTYLRQQIKLAADLAAEIEKENDFELIIPQRFNLLCFRYHPKRLSSEHELNQLNEKLLLHLNHSGQIFLTHCKLADTFVLRLCIGQTNVQAHHVIQAWDLIKATARNL